MLLNEKISVIRKINNLTQEQFAEVLDISRQAVSKWEKGDSIPDIKMLIKIADYYNVTLDELVREEYDLSSIKESQMNTEEEKLESKINIEQYIGKICDVSINSFRYSVIRNVEIVGIDNDIVCFIKNKKYGYFNIKKTLGIKSGSGKPNREKVAKLTKAQVQAIAEQKMEDLNAASLESAMSMVAGTARSMGITVEE